MSQYPKTLRAAKGVSTDQKSMAAAILAEIPPVHRGGKPDRGSVVADALKEMVKELAEVGYVYSTATLADYRDVAIWAAGNDRGTTAIAWQPISWNTHVEAYKGGMTWRQFSQYVEKGDITKVDDVRRLLNKRAARRNTPKEKLDDLKDMVKGGQVTAEDLAELPEEAVSRAYEEQRRRRIKRQTREAAEEDMTDTEIDQADEQIDGLRKTVTQARKTNEAVASEVQGSPTFQVIQRLKRDVGQAYSMYQKHGLYSGEEAAVTLDLDAIAHTLDLMRMAIGGAILTQEDQEFLDSLAS